MGPEHVVITLRNATLRMGDPDFLVSNRFKAPLGSVYCPEVPGIGAL